MLQVVEGSAVGDSRYHCAQLQRGHGHAFTEGAHFAHAAHLFRDYSIGVNAWLFASDVVSGQFAQAVFVRVVGDLLKPELASQSLEVGIVGVRQGHGEIHAAAPAERHRGVFLHQTFVQCR